MALVLRSFHAGFSTTLHTVAEKAGYVRAACANASQATARSPSLLPQNRCTQAGGSLSLRAMSAKTCLHTLPRQACGRFSAKRWLSAAAHPIQLATPQAKIRLTGERALERGVLKMPEDACRISFHQRWCVHPSFAQHNTASAPCFILFGLKVQATILSEQSAQ